MSDRKSSGDYQRDVGQFVRNYVSENVSCLISDLAKGYGGDLDSKSDIGQLAEEAFELCTSQPDYEEAADQEGLEVRECEDGGGWEYSTKDARDKAKAWTPGEDETEEDRPNPWEYLAQADDESEALQQACEAERVEPYEREIYEHWIVDRWLAARLAERGEKVGDFSTFKVWGRATTGQAILLDGVICGIYDALHAPTKEESANG